jgi:hypothetical protein
MTGFYDPDGNPIDLGEWATLWQGDRQVALTRVDDVEVSTVWLGTDYNFGFGGAPLIFETLVFGGTLDGVMNRYPNRAAAIAGHDQIVAEVRDVEGIELPSTTSRETP